VIFMFARCRSPKRLQMKVISTQHCLVVCVDDAQSRDVAADAAAESVRSNSHSSDVITVQV